MGGKRKYSDKEVKIELSKFTSTKDLIEKSMWAYAAAKRRGFLEEFELTQNTQWSKKTDLELHEVAKKFKFKSDFCKELPGAYNEAKKRGLFNLITSHMGKKVFRQYTDEQVILEGKKFETKKDFRKFSINFYTVAVKRKLIYDLEPFWTPSGSKYFRCIYALIFPDKAIYFGLSLDFSERINSHLSKSCNKYVRELLKTQTPKIIQLTGYMERQDARVLERSKIKEFKSRGWRVLNIKNGGELGGLVEKYSDESIMEKVMDCKSMAEFREKYPSFYSLAAQRRLIEKCHAIFGTEAQKSRALVTFEECLDMAKDLKGRSELYKKSTRHYMAAKNNGWLDLILPLIYNPQGKYETFEECQKAAAQCDSRWDFSKKFRVAYYTSRKNGWMDIFFKDKRKKNE